MTGSAEQLSNYETGPAVSEEVAVVAKVEVQVEQCKGCQLCCWVCPTKTLSLSQTINPKGYNPVMVAEPEACLGCALCVQVCPDLALTVSK